MNPELIWYEREIDPTKVPFPRRGQLGGKRRPILVFRSIRPGSIDIFDRDHSGHGWGSSAVIDRCGTIYPSNCGPIVPIGGVYERGPLRRLVSPRPRRMFHFATKLRRRVLSRTRRRVSRERKAFSGRSWVCRKVPRGPCRPEGGDRGASKAGKPHVGAEHDGGVGLVASRLEQKWRRNGRFSSRDV